MILLPIIIPKHIIIRINNVNVKKGEKKNKLRVIKNKNVKFLHGKLPGIKNELHAPNWILLPIIVTNSANSSSVLCKYEIGLSRIRVTLMSISISENLIHQKYGCIFAEILHEYRNINFNLSKIFWLYDGLKVI